MCNIVEASFILIHTLKNRSFCTIYDLVEKKYAIEKSIPSVYIDVSKNAIHSCVAHFPKIFEIDDDRIIKKDDASRFFNEPLIRYFDIDIDPSLKTQITGLLNE